jgi:hypothetical protein
MSRQVTARKPRYKTHLYLVDVAVWEDCGHGQMNVLCEDLKDACLVKQALEKVFPKHIDSSCGDSKISRRTAIEVRPAHAQDLKNLVLKEDGEW